MPDLLWNIGLLLGGIILASLPVFILRRRESWRPLAVPMTMFVGLTGFVGAQLFLNNPLGTWVGLAILGPAMVISFPLVRAQLAVRAAHTPIHPGESEESVEVALRRSDQLDILERRRRILLKRGVPVLALGFGFAVWMGVWTPLLVMSGAVALTGAALWPGLFRRPGTLAADSGTVRAERLGNEDGSRAVLSDRRAEAPDYLDARLSSPRHAEAIERKTRLSGDDQGLA